MQEQLKYPEVIEKIKALGYEPYARKFDRNATISEIRQRFDSLKPDTRDEGVIFRIAGRIRTRREHGKLIFMDLEDFSGRIQLYIEVAKLTKREQELLMLISTSDIIGVSGFPLKTKRGELSLYVKEITILTKALKTIPNEWFGLKDQETRYRQRYLDILINKEVKDMIIKRSLFWQNMREFLLSKGFIEVETPVLESRAGGASAKPFITHHNALDIDLYLRICAGELWQKRLLVAGFEKTFEIGRVFRNEGIDMEHAQDYTMMEFYWAYANYKMAMELVEEMYKNIALKTFGTLKFEMRGFSVDLGKKWEEYDYVKTVKKFTDIDILNTNLEECLKKLNELGVEYDKKKINLERAIDNLWKYCRKKIGGPGFLINHPVIVSPLAKRNPENPNITERFQVIIAGSEIGNGYSELNDPVDQAARFMEQQKLREAGDEEAQMFDRDFVEALEYGMPPAAGFGVSERLFAFFANKPVREAQIFPLLRPEKE